MQFGEWSCDGSGVVICYFSLVPYFHILLFVLFALFKLAGWPKRAPIARGSQWVPKDLAALSLDPSPSGSIGLISSAQSMVKSRGHELAAAREQLSLS